MGDHVTKFEALKVGELARRTGLTVRTLHHYHDVGLVKPSAQTPSGHRLYTRADVARLQQVLSLRQLGFSLEEIRDCLERPGYSAREILRMHVARLREQITLQQRLCTRLEVLAGQLDASGEVSADELLNTMEEMTRMEKLYTPEQLEQFQQVGQAVGQDEIAAVQEEWTALLAEVRANHHLDPATPQAQELGRRWEALTERTMRGYQAFPELKEAIAENYRQGNFEGDTRAPQAADFDFIARVKAAREGGAAS
ncbi:MAG TPA: MerR family transcriptional regulator [Longimicrobium sp.]|nr:MerR family transcriptional regulator [Longimicrobium sp.]